MIERHQITESSGHLQALDAFWELLNPAVNAAIAETSLFGSIFRDSLNAMAVSFTLRPDEERNAILLELASDLAYNCFLSAMNPGEKITLELNDQTWEGTGVASGDHVDAYVYRFAWYIAVINRDRRTLDLLTEFPMELVKGAEDKGTEMDYAAVEFLQGIYNPEANIGGLLINAAEATDPEQLSEEYHDEALELRWPELNLYRFIIPGELEELSSAFQESLEGHKSYWGEEFRKNDPMGWISFPLLAAAVIARGGKDLDLEVASEYLPAWIVDGEF